MRSKDVLKEAIRDFDGTVIIVSHDRDFLDGLATKVYEFGGGLVKEHLGGIYDFLQKKQIESLNDLQKSPSLSFSPSAEKTVAGGNAGATVAQPSAAKLSYEEQEKGLNKRLKKLERRVADCEAEIEQTEAAISILEAKMATPEGASDMAPVRTASETESPTGQCDGRVGCSLLRAGRGKEIITFILYKYESISFFTHCSILSDDRRLQHRQEAGWFHSRYSVCQPRHNGLARNGFLPIRLRRLDEEQSHSCRVFTYGSFTILAENNRKQIQGLIEELAATQHEAGSVAQKVGDLYKIVMDSVKLNKDGVAPIKAELDRLGALKDRKEVYALLGEMQKKGIVAYNVLYVGADEMNSSMNAVQSYQAGLSMGEREYYLENDEATAKIRNAFRAHVQKMYQLAGFDEAAAKKGVEVVMDVETRLAKAFRSRTELRNPHANYNKMTLEELKKNYPTFDWDAYLSALDLKDVQELLS